MNILVTGANGQLGQTIAALHKSLLPHSNFRFVSRNELDVTNTEAVRKALNDSKVNFLINCAAYTNVDGAEDNIELANEINGYAVGRLAEVCSDIDITLIHISTDYVFDGYAAKPYEESNKTNPINVYGKSKLLGEKLIEQNLTKYFIIRTSWLYSAFGHNFVKTIVKKVNENADLNIITSQRGCPTSCADLANFIAQLIKQDSAEYGVYHFCSKNETDWYGFAKQIASYFEAYNKEKLKPIESYPTKAERPIYSVMNTEKASGYVEIKEWETSLDTVLETLKK